MQALFKKTGEYNMPSKKPMITLRTEQEIIDKLNYISAFENRSQNKQLEYIVKNHILEFEKQHGKIELEIK